MEMRPDGRLRHMGLLAVLLAAAMFALAACGSDDDDQGSGAAAGTAAEEPATATPVKLGIVEFTGIAPTQLGIDKGIFEKHGIDLELVPADNPAAISAQVLSGQLDMGFATTTYHITAAAKGAPLVAVSAVDGVINPEQAVSAIVVKKDSSIRSPKDLTGKKVGVVALGSELDVLMKKVTDDDGGDSSKVQSVQIPFPQMQAALKAGRVDAIVTTEPFLSLSRKAGGRVISEPEVELLPNGSVTAYTASRNYIEQNREVVERFQAAMRESLEYAKANRDEALQAVAKVTGLDQEEAEGSALGTIYNPVLDRLSIEKMQDLLLEYELIPKKVPVDELVLEGA
jgi:NitT/TauT family transport system substrate-binding protein